MRQIGLALHNYHDTYGHFPAGRQSLGLTPTDNNGVLPNANGDFNETHWMAAPHILLFPFIEATAAWSGIQGLSGRVPSGWMAPWSAEVAEFLVGPFPTFRCPSDGEAQRPSTFQFTDQVRFPFRVARYSYRFSLGDGMWNTTEWYGSRHIGGPRTYNRGMFTALHLKDMGYISDGTSNTIGFSERAVTSQQGQPAGNIGPVTDFSVRSGTWGGAPIHDAGRILPANCLNGARAPGDRNMLHSAHPAWSGQLFGDGRPGNSGFNTVLPPNSPSCLWGTGGGGAGWGVFSASSFHAGGVNGVFMDGSVRFIPDTINTGDLNGAQGGYHAGSGSAPVQSGPSNYGVWGALGTPQGGETASL